MGNSEIHLLKKLIGLKDIWLYTLHMTIIWERSVTVPDFSIKCGKKWIIVEPIIEGFEDSYVEWNRIEINESETPKNVDYVLVEGGHKVMNRALSSIDFPRPYAVTSIEIYKFTESDPEKEDAVIEYLGCIVFNVDDKRRFAISSYKTPAGTLEFTMDKIEIEKLVSVSSQRNLIT